MKKILYLFSYIVLLTTFFGFKKANSYDFDRGFITTVANSREGQTTNGLITNMDVHSYSSNVAFSGTNELDAYWYGVGIGIGETLCYSKANGYIKDKVARTIIRDLRNLYEEENLTFEEGIELANDTYPGCNL